MFGNYINRPLVTRAALILTKRERTRVALVLLIQIFLGLLDLLGIAMIGALGALAVTGIGSQGPGSRVSSVLRFFSIEDYSLQSQALWLGLIAAITLVSKTILSLVLVRKTTFFLSRRGASISARLIAKVLAQPLSALQEKSIQQTQYVITAGVDTITMGILNASVVLVSDVFLLAILGMGLFVVDPWISISTALLFGSIAFLLYILMARRSRYLGIHQAELSIETNERIMEVLTSYRELVVRNRRGYYAREIGILRLKIANAVAERAFMPNISKYAIEIVFVIGAFTIAIFQFATSTASEAIATLGVFLVASTRIAPAVLRLQQGALTIKSSAGAAKQTLELIETLSEEKEIEVTDEEIRVTHSDFEGRIELKDLSFFYPGKTNPVIKDVSLSIREGDFTAIVGPSGAGKTTLGDLILGILQPTSGSVLIGGRSPDKVIKQYPGAIGYVPQDVVIMNGTIRDNVSMGFPWSESLEEFVWEALEIAQLREVVEEMPRGLRTEVGSRGVKLSGGQRQRLGIARAMFTKPALLVLDEATSALDGQTEHEFSKAISQLRGKVTIVVIAHRLSTVRGADRLVFLSEGRVLGVDSFEKLRAQVKEFDEQALLMGM